MNPVRLPPADVRRFSASRQTDRGELHVHAAKAGLRHGIERVRFTRAAVLGAVQRENGVLRKGRRCEQEFVWFKRNFFPGKSGVILRRDNRGVDEMLRFVTVLSENQRPVLFREHERSAAEHEPSG